MRMGLELADENRQDAAKPGRARSGSIKIQDGELPCDVYDANEAGQTSSSEHTWLGILQETRERLGKALT